MGKKLIFVTACQQRRTRRWSSFRRWTLSSPLSKSLQKSKKDINTKKNKAWIRFIILISIIIIPAALLYATGTFHLFLDRRKLAKFLNSLGAFSYLGFICLQIFQVVAAPIPGEVTGFIGGLMYGVTIGILLSTLGLTIGSWLAFILSKLFGRPLVEKIVKKETIDRYDYLLHSKGIILIFVLFLLPGFPKDYLCYILGLGHLSTKEFLMVSTFGRLGGTIMLTLGGNYIKNNQYQSFIVLISMVIIIIIFMVMYRERIEEGLKKWQGKKR